VATFSKPYIIKVLLFLAGAPLLHQFLHSADGPSESYAVLQTHPNENEKYQHTLTESPDVAQRGSASFADTPATFGGGLQKSASKDESADTLRDMDLVLVEIGPPLNADEPAQWTQEEYRQEINIGPPLNADEPAQWTQEEYGQEIDIGLSRSADTWTYHEDSELKPIDTEKESSEVYPDIIEIGPEMDVNRHR